MGGISAYRTSSVSCLHPSTPPGLKPSLRAPQAHQSEDGSQPRILTAVGARRPAVGQAWSLPYGLQPSGAASHHDFETREETNCVFFLVSRLHPSPLVRRTPHRDVTLARVATASAFAAYHRALGSTFRHHLREGVRRPSLDSSKTLARPAKCSLRQPTTRCTFKISLTTLLWGFYLHPVV